MAAMEQSAEIAALVSELTTAPNVRLNDPRLEAGLQALVGAGLIEAERIPELLSYARPEPVEPVVELVAEPVAEPEVGE